MVLHFGFLFAVTFNSEFLLTSKKDVKCCAKLNVVHPDNYFFYFPPNYAF